MNDIIKKIIEGKGENLIMFVLSVIGGVFLLLLDIFLRRKKGVKDPTLIWMYIGIFSWIIRNIILLLVDFKSDNVLKRVTFAFSPITNVLFTLVAFNFSRIKENKNIQKYFAPALTVIIIASVFTFLAMVIVTDKGPLFLFNCGKVVDLISSLLALGLLGLGLCYSFKIYGFKEFFFAALIIIIGYMAAQVLYVVSPNSVSYGFTKLLFFPGFIILLVSQPTVWGISVYSKLNAVDAPSDRPVIAVLFDLRGSTKWVKDLGDGHRLLKFLNSFRNFLLYKIKKIQNKLEPSMIKYLGDGYLIVWEFKSPPTADLISEFSKCAEHLCREYKKSFVQNREIFFTGVPTALGIGIITGTAFRLTLENGDRDYIGEMMNKVSKLQNLARPNGGVVISRTVLQALDEETLKLFPHKGTVRLIPNTEKEMIGATAEVDPYANKDADFCPAKGEIEKK